MSDGVLKKADKDYSSEVEVELRKMAKLSLTDLDSALEQLLVWEKKVRQANDLVSSKQVLEAIVKSLAKPQLENWDRLDEMLLILVKKHGQSKQAITHMVQKVIDLLGNAPNLKIKLAIIETLRSITEGRIYLELERARVTQILAQIEVKENGNYSRAAELMGELQVETFGSMEMAEKIDFILEQVDLYIKKQDFNQAAIASRKIITRYFIRANGDPRVNEQKLKFYDLKFQIALHDHAYLDVCQNLRFIYDTKSIQYDDKKKHEILGNMVLFVVLAPHDNLQSDILHHLTLDADLKVLPLFEQLATMFTTMELIRWPKMVEIYGSELREHSVFSDKEHGEAIWEDLHQRIIEHNIRVVAKFYTRISIQGLSELLDLSADVTETVLAKLVVNGTVWARIDRPQHVVTFAKEKDVEDALNEWSNNTAKLLNHIETIGHLIAKEEMMHGLKSVSSEA